MTERERFHEYMRRWRQKASEHEQKKVREFIAWQCEAESKKALNLAEYHEQEKQRWLQRAERLAENARALREAT